MRTNYSKAEVEASLVLMSQRERKLDPQLPVRGRPGNGTAPTTCLGDAAPSVIAAITNQVLEQGDPGALWGPLNSSTLSVRWDGNVEALAQLLREWPQLLPPEFEARGDWETSLQLQIPSRDSSMVRPLLAAGFAQVGVSAIRVGVGSPQPGRSPSRLADLGITMREAAFADAGMLGVMDAELLAHDSQHGVLENRAGAAQALQVGIERRLAAHPGWTWIAEQQGEPVGYLSVEPGRGTELVAHVPGSNVAFLQALYLRPTVRGGGVGESIAEFAHRQMAQAGYERVLLSYASLNPRSGPFWSRMGYRPLWSEWQRRPVRAVS